MPYIRYLDIVCHLGINKGDKLLISSDINRLVYSIHLAGETFDINRFIDSFIEAVGETGTVAFPTYNWDFCEGKTFDYRSTKSKVGSLSNAALKRQDFKRTKHPFYSYAVWGADKDALCSLTNKSAFGNNSPFVYFYNNSFINLAIDVNYDKFATFIHYCEEKTGVTYRFMKDFTAEYIDEDGISEVRTYSMYVRPLNYKVGVNINPLHDILLENDAVRESVVNGIPYYLVKMKPACDLAVLDIKDNSSKNIAIYPGCGVPVCIETEMHLLAIRLFPICRSITGNGVRETLRILQEVVPQLTVHEVPSGTQAFDWTVPKEWNIRDAYIEDMDGNRVISFEDSNLHVVGYSLPIDKIITKEELLGMVYTQPDQPDAIPYVTSYYKERSGFCMTEKKKQSLNKDKYHVVIDSELKDGSLTYGEILIPGKEKEEIFLSTYICHPSIANNELSGPCVAIHLARWLLEQPRRYTYRIIFIPETIGSITYLSRNLDEMKRNIIAGFNITCVGDNKAYSYIASRHGDTLADRVAMNVLRDHAPDYKSYSFLKRGSDERQYNAPGVDLPVCSICRSKYGEYPEYHTSADNLEFISPEGLGGAFEVYRKCIKTLEVNCTYRVTCLCEPQLGKRGLYPTISQKGNYDAVEAMMNLIAYADGKNDLIAISDIIGIPALELAGIALMLKDNGLLVGE